MAIISIPSFTIQQGKKSRVLTSPFSFFKLDLTLNFNAFPADAFLSILLQVSTDGGQTQRDFGGWNTGPGLHDRHGAATSVQMIFSVSDITPAGAQVTINTDASTDLLLNSGILVAT